MVKIPFGLQVQHVYYAIEFINSRSSPLASFGETIVTAALVTEGAPSLTSKVPLPLDPDMLLFLYINLGETVPEWLGSQIHREMKQDILTQLQDYVVAYNSKTSHTSDEIAVNNSVVYVLGQLSQRESSSDKWRTNKVTSGQNILSNMRKSLLNRP